ncbi:pentapeptide repeat-containing protein [Amycolatopsis sp. NPDC059090]|uniref:pentapeptide repeat-containing protein n=1 Tax=unclassified Amycolatopsis TaxID=2618356 RepID=UPI00366B9F71
MKERLALKPIPRWVILAGLPAMVALAAVAVWVLLAFAPDSAQLDAIRTGGTLGVGLGGAVALWLAVRRQRSTELDLLQKHEAHRLAEQVAADTREHQLRTAADAREDALARRVTEQYGKAVDQLGSERAPVRLGGLYALERLGQDHADSPLRQMIADVLCAYLRMPSEDTAEEAQVRRTAQKIIANHSRPANERHWPGLHLDFSGANLDQADFGQCRFDNILFTGTAFTGIANFAGTVFSVRAGFIGASFHGTADFENARFPAEADFRGADFAATAEFSSARFADAHFDMATFADAHFRDAKFRGRTSFDGSVFAEHAAFQQARFDGHTSFDHAKFRHDVSLHRSRFADSTSFADVSFQRYAGLRSIRFDGPVRFRKVRFGGDFDFGESEFAGAAELGHALVWLDREGAVLHNCPEGWTLGDPEDGWAPLTRTD